MSWSPFVKELVQSRATGRCEYCLLDQSDVGLPHEIDHVISRKHGGSESPENLAFACYLCNRFKGSDIASLHPIKKGLVRLFHPRQDRWGDHFRITGPVLEPLTDIGMVTTNLLRLNHAARVIERKLLQALNRYPKSS